MKCSFVGCNNEIKNGCFGLIEFKGFGRVVFPLCEKHFLVVKKINFKSGLN